MTFTVEVDWDRDGDFADTGEDVTARVRARQAAISLAYGRDQSTALAPTVAGRGSFVLDNTSRDYSPRNTASPLYGLLKPARPVRISRTVGGLSLPFTLDASAVLEDVVDCILFLGHTDDNPINPDIDGKTVTLSLVDSLADFRGVNISTPLYSGIRTGTAIGYILDAAGWTGARDLDPGATVIPWWWEDNTDALTAMEKVLQAEGPPALLTIGVDGAVEFKDRHHRLIDAPSLTSQQTWVESDGLTIPAAAATPPIELNVSGGEFGTVPGTYDTDYHYDGQASLDALYALGIRHIRVPIKMDRLQPTPGAAFNSTEQTRVADFVNRIAAAGLTCKIEAHNYARRVVSGTTYVLGEANYTQAHHADFFSRLGTLFASSPTVTQLGYNEPHDLAGVAGTFTPAITHYNFEATLQGWAVESVGTIVRTTTTPITGTGSALYNKTFAAGFDTARFNDASGLADDISANGATLQIKLKARSANVGTGTQARIEVQNSSFAWQAGPWFPVTVGTGGTYGAVATLQYTPTAGLLANCRAIGIQFEGTGLNGSTDVQIDDVQQGTNVGALTPAQQWQAADQAAYAAVVAAGFTGSGKEYHAAGYAWSGAKDYTSINGSPWITATTLPVRYEAHSYGDNDRSGTYGASYATETTNAVAQGYASVGARWSASIGDFVTWCNASGVNGVIGEIGWPDDPGWNTAGASALTTARAASLKVTYWAVGEWWGTGYALSPWEWTGSAYSANGQAAVLLAGTVSTTPISVTMNKPFVYDEAWRNIINTGTVEVGVRQGKDPEAVWTNDATITLAAGETQTVTASTSDPFFNAATPVAGTDYTVISGTPTVSLATINGASAAIQITAGGGVPAIIEGLQLRAQPVTVAYSVKVSQSYEPSVDDYGPRSLPNDLGWCNQYDAAAVLLTAIAQRAQPNPIVEVRFLVGDDVSRAAAVLTRDLSDRITITEAETAIHDDFYIEAIQHDWTSDFDHSVTFGLEMVPKEAPVPTDTSFIFGDATYGVFNTGTFSTGLIFTGDLFKFDDTDKGFDEGGFAY